MLYRLTLALLFISTTTIPNVSAATITGKIIYEGKQPKLRPIKMDADPVCLTHHSDKVMPKSISLSENNELKHVLVFVANGVPKKAYPPHAEQFILDQKGCMYEPPVFAVMTGQEVKILNPDGTLHNVHSLSKVNPEFNLAMPKFRTEVIKIFEKEELWFPIKCDVHPWMVTYGNVFSHPYYDTTDEKGMFTIENLPAGDYVIEARQQRLSPQKVNVTLAEGETKEINFTFSRPDGE